MNSVHFFQYPHTPCSTDWLASLSLTAPVLISMTPYFTGDQTVTLHDPEPISHGLRLKYNPPSTFQATLLALTPANPKTKAPSAKATIRKTSWTVSHRVPEPTFHLLQFTHSSTISSAPTRHHLEARMQGKEPRPASRWYSGSGHRLWTQEIRFQSQLCHLTDCVPET